MRQSRAISEPSLRSGPDWRSTFLTPLEDLRSEISQFGKRLLLWLSTGRFLQMRQSSWIPYAISETLLFTTPGPWTKAHSKSHLRRFVKFHNHRGGPNLDYHGWAKPLSFQSSHLRIYKNSQSVFNIVPA